MRVTTAPPSVPPEKLVSLFSVYAAEPKEGIPALLGTHSLENGDLVFRPRFPLQPGLKVWAVFTPEEGERVVEVFEIPGDDSSRPAIVEAVYPSAGVLPENLLKFYLHFSSPMSRGGVYRYVELIDQETSRPVDLPFLEIEQELWDAEQRRLTLFIDPGRIKSGLLPNKESGTALITGRRYRLRVDASWPDAWGVGLASSFEKVFEVGRADRLSPNPQKWEIEPPRAGGRDALEARFGEPLDHALISRLLEVISGDRRPIRGKGEVMAGEIGWRFVPERPWEAGSYLLRFGSWLEDLAGNRIGRPFEVDVFDPIQERLLEGDVTVPFVVAP